jgi:hypothetical protein
MMTVILKLVIVGLAILFVGRLPLQAANQSQSALMFYPQQVANGEAFVAYVKTSASDANQPRYLYFEAQKPFILTATGCTYLKKPPDATAFSCFVMPNKVFGDTYVVYATDSSFKKRLSGESRIKVFGSEAITGGEIPVGDGTEEMLQYKPGTEVQLENKTRIYRRSMPRTQPVGLARILTWVPKSQALAARPFFSTPGTELNEDAPSRICNGVVFEETTNITAGKFIEDKGKALTDVAITYKADPVPNWSAPMGNYIRNATRIENLQKSVNLGSPMAVARPRPVVILDTAISNSNDDYVKKVIYEEAPRILTPIDIRGHGSIIGRIINSISPESSIKYRKVCDEGGICDTKDVIEQMCDALADNSTRSAVYNLSLGGNAESEILGSLIEEAGIDMVGSAGNKQVYYETKKFVGNQIQYPAYYGISVAALGQYGTSWQPADFSQRNKADLKKVIAAPGVKLKSQGLNYEYSGTSFAAPFVSAAIARFGRGNVFSDVKNSGGCKPLAVRDPQAVGCGILDLSNFK